METDRPIKEVLQRIAFECQESGATKWQVLKIIKELEEFEGTEQQLRKIGSEVEGKIKDLKIEYLNTHIIREMVNVKLLEYGHEPVHSQYARIGMPVYEVKKNLDTRGFDGSWPY